MSSRRLRGVLLTSAFVLATVPALAPGALAADALTLTTPYPSVTVSPGTRVSFNLSVKTSSSARVDLRLSGVPASWTAALHGGGFVVGAVETSGNDPTEVRLDVDVPADATGTTTITVTAQGNGAKVDLPLDIRAEANVGGEVKVESDYETLRGSSDQTFTFNLNVTNQKEEDLTYSAASGTTPPGWTVETKLTASAQAASATVKAGGTAGVTVTVTPADNADANTYPMQVITTVGTEQFTTDLSVEITGSYGLTLSTPDQTLSTHGTAGSVTEQTFTITNTGTAPVTNVTLSATAPTNWKVDFDPTTTDTIAPDQTVRVTAKITPSADAIAGDYEVPFRVKAAEAASDDATVRFTVEASILGAVVGAALIVAAIGGLYWVFRRYGRR